MGWLASLRAALEAYNRTMAAVEKAANLISAYLDKKWAEELDAVVEKLDKSEENLTSEDRKEMARRLAALTERVK